MQARFFRIWLALFFLSAGLAHGAVASDQLLRQLTPQGYVNDFAGVLNAPEKSQLESYLAEVERTAGAEIAVVTVSSLNGGDVDDFTNRLFAKWGVGKKGKDNGVMILAAIQDHKARIEVGYGLEGVIPDAEAGRILREQMFPAFRQGRYGEGLTRVVQVVVGKVAGNSGVPLVASQPSAVPTYPPSHPFPVESVRTIMIFGFIGIFFLWTLLRGGSRRYRSSYGGWYYGGGFSSGSGFSSGGSRNIPI